jgi:penicillin-binding protein 1A
VFQEKPATACRTCSVGSQPGSAAQPLSSVVDGFNLGPAGSTPAPAATAAKTQAASSTAKPALPADGVLAPRAIDPRVAYQIVSMMRDVVQRGTGTAAKVLGREDVAGKTGSTNDHRDAWFSGLGGPYVTTVWVGRDDFKSLGYREYGGKAALPIWIDYMRTALKDQPIAANDPPAGMVKVAVSAGGRLLPGGNGGITEYVKAEDLERMESVVDYGPDEENATPDEESFDIF